VRILIVEDDDSIREFVSTFLVDEGYEIMLAKNGVEALDMLQHEHPQLIFLDVYMPVMDGPAFVEEYRQRVSETAPIIGMSANANEAKMLGCFDGFLAKPFDLTELLACVETYAKA
jgi:two-component system, OmpR family, response regulator MprA